MSWFRRRRVQSEELLAAFLDSPEGQEELARLTHCITAEPSELSPSEAEVRSNVDMRAEDNERIAQDILPRARADDADPERVAADVARKYPAAAAWVGYRVWETQLEEADGTRVEEIARQLAEESPNHVFHEAKRWRLLRECEKRGISPPPGGEQFNDPISRSMEDRGLSPAVMDHRLHIVMLTLDKAIRGRSELRSAVDKRAEGLSQEAAEPLRAYRYETTREASDALAAACFEVARSMDWQAVEDYWGDFVNDIAEECSPAVAAEFRRGWDRPAVAAEIRRRFEGRTS